jgi:hypothetical protein
MPQLNPMGRYSVHTGERAIHSELFSIFDIAPKVYDLTGRLQCGWKRIRPVTAASFRVSAPAVGLMASGLPENLGKPINNSATYPIDIIFLKSSKMA